jgi:hypothetical protein
MTDSGGGQITAGAHTMEIAVYPRMRVIDEVLHMVLGHLSKALAYQLLNSLIS